MSGGTMHVSIARKTLYAALSLAALAAAGCAIPENIGSFDKTYTVTGPVRLEVQNGSGAVRITPGGSGQVRIHGEIRAQTWPSSSRRRAEEFRDNPPIEQSGNTIRVGTDPWKRRFVGVGYTNISVAYTIEVPSETEVQAMVGSGGVELRGVKGPAELTSGSGRISAEEIGGDISAQTGSGGVTINRAAGDARATTGSGGITITDAKGEVRASAGSGGIDIDRPGGRVTARTGSGHIEVHGAGSDLRVTAASGGLTVQGNPTATSYWELRTGSGSVTVDVPQDASFRLYAHTGSGSISTELPLLLEEQASRRELRGRIGNGAARVEVHTASGSIHIR